jgi:hypothetical protein
MYVEYWYYTIRIHLPDFMGIPKPYESSAEGEGEAGDKTYVNSKLARQEGRKKKTPPGSRHFDGAIHGTTTELRGGDETHFLII